MGGTFTVTKTDNWNDTIVPTVHFGTDANDPAYNYFSETNQTELPGRHERDMGRPTPETSTAMLTGRVTSCRHARTWTMDSTATSANGGTG